eukprot:6153409-Alexandrium_andersonii.AAC.1
MGAVAVSPAPATASTAPRSTLTNHSCRCHSTSRSGPADKSAVLCASSGPAVSMTSLAARGSK